MKKIASIYLLIVFSFLLFSACSDDNKNLFDLPTSERVDKAMSAYADLLIDSPNGWLMEYYPSKELEHGGYAFVMKFYKDGTVEVFSQEAEDLSKSVKSFYALKTDMGPVLSFDTYNSLFHYFSSPEIFGGGLVLGKGYEGDYEFIFRIPPGKHDVITLEGKKTRNIIRMYKMTEPAVDYLTKVQKNVKYFDEYRGLDGFTTTVAGQDYFFELFDRANIVAKTVDAEGNLALGAGEKIRFIFTDEGLKFHEPSSIFGSDIQYFNIVPNGEELDLKCTDKGADNIVLNSKRIVDFGLDYSEYLGDYELTYKAGRSHLKDITIPVKLTKVRQNRAYKLMGLPLKSANGEPLGIDVLYKKAGVIEIVAHTLASNIWIAPWEVQPVGSLDYSKNYGLIGKIVADTPLSIEMVHNGSKWPGDNNTEKTTKGFIIWHRHTGEYKSFGPSRYGFLRLKKK